MPEITSNSVACCVTDIGTGRIYASNAGFYSVINRVYARFFPENPPSRTFVPVASWPMEFDIEIECVAVA
jgi:2-iminobutanoate/2-iminopropanoate deaminase